MNLNEKQKHILKVAEQLFTENGYEGTSVRDIAKAADINIAMISYYFESKDNLLKCLVKTHGEWTSKILKDLNKDEHKTAWEKVNGVIDFFVDRMLKNRNYYTIVSRQLSMEQKGNLSGLLIKIKRQNSAMIADIIKEGINKGEFKAVDNELTISTVVGTVSQVSMSRLFYSHLLGVDANDEEKYYEIITPKLKKHLKELLRAHLQPEIK